MLIPYAMGLPKFSLQGLCRSNFSGTLHATSNRERGGPKKSFKEINGAILTLNCLSNAESFVCKSLEQGLN